MEGYDKALFTKETEQVDLDEIKRMSWYLYAAYFVMVDDIYIVISWELMMDIYMLLVWMLLTDAYGADHIWCMAVPNNYHGIAYIFGICYKCHVYHLM